MNAAEIYVERQIERAQASRLTRRERGELMQDARCALRHQQGYASHSTIVQSRAGGARSAHLASTEPPSARLTPPSH